jgi:hypothetical protein
MKGEDEDHVQIGTRWFKHDRDYLCVNKSQFVPVIFEPPFTCTKKVEYPRHPESRLSFTWL